MWTSSEENTLMSSNDIAITVEDVSKIYRIGLKSSRSENLGSAMLDFLKNPWRNYKKYRSLYDFSDVDLYKDDAQKAVEHGLLWALKDISFEVARGEVVGIIGRNGAGKSTLLKILSRITSPTKGRLTTRGRVSSLLEVGTGFHPELTGRENVYLNGTVLGMRKKEVEQRFDEIVEFSGVEKFLDTPVKRYSSGMRVRLAFAVAAHLEPEILIVDEVLAVGDAAFQRKCLDKMEDVGKGGRTVLFVSHSMTAVTRMCERVILLENSTIAQDGSPHQVVSAYLQGAHGSPARRLWNDINKAPGGDVVRLMGMRVLDRNFEVSDAHDISQPIYIEVEYEVLESGHVVQLHLAFVNGEGTLLFVSVDLDETWRKRRRPAGRYVNSVEIPGDLLAEGMVIVNAGLWVLEPNQILQCYEKDVVSFQVLDNMDGKGARGDWASEYQGVMRPKLAWRTDGPCNLTDYTTNGGGRY